MTEEYIHRITWNEVEAYLNAVAERIEPHDFTGVYGIPRGGSVLAAWLSHKLYLPLLADSQPNCIIIDDIFDSGKTLRDHLNTKEFDKNNMYVTVMFCNPRTNAGLVDFYYKEKEDNWIVFPWEQ